MKRPGALDLSLIKREAETLSSPVTPVHPYIRKFNIDAKYFELSLKFNSPSNHLEQWGTKVLVDVDRLHRKLTRCLKKNASLSGEYANLITFFDRMTELKDKAAEVTDQSVRFKVVLQRLIKSEKEFWELLEPVISVISPITPSQFSGTPTSPFFNYEQSPLKVTFDDAEANSETTVDLQKVKVETPTSSFLIFEDSPDKASFDEPSSEYFLSSPNQMSQQPLETQDVDEPELIQESFETRYLRELPESALKPFASDPELSDFTAIDTSSPASTVINYEPLTPFSLFMKYAVPQPTQTESTPFGDDNQQSTSAEDACVDPKLWSISETETATTSISTALNSNQTHLVIAPNAKKLEKAVRGLDYEDFNGIPGEECIFDMNPEVYDEHGDKMILDHLRQNNLHVALVYPDGMVQAYCEKHIHTHYLSLQVLQSLNIPKCRVPFMFRMKVCTKAEFVDSKLKHKPHLISGNMRLVMVFGRCYGAFSDIKAKYVPKIWSRREIFYELLVKAMWTWHLTELSKTLQKAGYIYKKIRNLKKYKCKTCDMQFTFHTKYLRHVTTHVSCDAVICEFCGCKFGRVDAYQRHVLKRCQLKESDKFSLLYD